MPPLLALAATQRGDDGRPRITAHQLRVLIVLYDHLDPRGFRPVKLEWLARLACLRRRSSASDALRALVAAGYLYRGPKFCEPGGQCFGSFMLADPTLLVPPSAPIAPPRTPSAA